MAASRLLFAAPGDDGRELNVKVEGQLVLNDVDFLIDAAVAGNGSTLMVEDHVAAYIADGRLIRVLEDWCEPFDSHYLYYPQPAATLSCLQSSSGGIEVSRLSRLNDPF